MCLRRDRRSASSMGISQICLPAVSASQPWTISCHSIPVPTKTGESNIDPNRKPNAEDQRKANEKIVPPKPICHENPGIDSEKNKKASKTDKDRIDNEERRSSSDWIHIIRWRPLRDDTEGWENHHAEPYEMQLRYYIGRIWLWRTVSIESKLTLLSPMSDVSRCADACGEENSGVTGTSATESRCPCLLVNLQTRDKQCP